MPASSPACSACVQARPSPSLLQLQGEETGPGQIAARTLIETYRIDQVDAATKVYGVAGNPIKSSLSPIMMNTAFRPRRRSTPSISRCRQRRCSDLLKLVQEIPIQGLSVTMPHKQEIMAVSGKDRSPFGQDRRLQYSSSRTGWETLRPSIPMSPASLGHSKSVCRLRGTKVLVLGAGGAARAAVFGLRDKGAEVFILNRTC